MATKIRLQRIGAKKKPFYRIVIADERTAPTGKVLDHVGTYNPHTDPPEIKTDLIKIDEWISKGAQPTPKVNSILKRARKQNIAN